MLLAACLLSFVVLTLGQRIPGNLTVAFYPDDAQNSCNALDISKALVLTTATVLPFRAATCFNLNETFNASSSDLHFEPSSISVGSTRVGTYWRDPNSAPQMWNSQLNYSRVWYQQDNGTYGKLEVGKNAPWTVTVYAYQDCHDVGRNASGAIVDDKDAPWFTTSCQTDEGGQCRTVPYSVKSFRILYGPSAYNSQCKDWAFLGAASSVRTGGSLLLLVFIGLAAAICLIL